MNKGIYDLSPQMEIVSRHPSCGLLQWPMARQLSFTFLKQFVFEMETILNGKWYRMLLMDSRHPACRIGVEDTI